jgi:hypothetical protein
MSSIAPKRKRAVVRGALASTAALLLLLPSPVPGAGRVAPGKAPELALLFTGDVVGYIEPCG